MINQNQKSNAKSENNTWKKYNLKYGKPKVWRSNSKLLITIRESRHYKNLNKKFANQNQN